MAELSRMSEYELRDIGLTRPDVNDATALPLDDDPSALLVRRRAGASAPSRGRPRRLIELDATARERDGRPSTKAGERSTEAFPQRSSPPFRRSPHDSALGRSRRRGHARPGARQAEILSDEALAFLAGLHRQVRRRRLELLARRTGRQKLFDAGKLPDFLPETKSIRDGDWKVAPIPADLLDRRVEITGPVDRKMIVNALNSGAKVFMADFEDATSPVFANMIEGQANLKDLWAGQDRLHRPATGKAYALKSNPAVLMVRPRGWHLPERHVAVDGEEMSGSLFDFGLYVFHCAKAQMAQGATPAFYLPKMESHLEARLWDEVFSHAEEELGVPHGTFKATVLIETLPAAFEMDEILYELRDHIVGLNCGRWDYIFSFIKRLGKNPAFLTPDRSEMTMGKAFLSAYSLLLIKTCHRRGAFAMGGMAAQIPVKGDAKANEAAFAKVRADKEREAGNGHDGTWVAHPDLVPVAMEVFDRLMPQPNQLDKLREDVHVTPPIWSRCTRASAPKRACARTSASACNISRRGCAAAAPCRSTI